MRYGIQKSGEVEVEVFHPSMADAAAGSQGCEEVRSLAPGNAGGECVDSLHSQPLDALLLDLQLPLSHSGEIFLRIKTGNTKTRVLVISAECDAEHLPLEWKLWTERPVPNALNGALAGKTGSLVSAIESMSECKAGRGVPEPTSKPDPTPNSFLSAIDHKILLGLVEGQRNKEIALALGISDKTVRNRLIRVFEKLGVSSRVEAARHYASGNYLTSR